jgi:hypothetical protein
VAVLDEGPAEGGRSVALAAAGWAEQQQVGTLLEPGVAGGERHQAGLAEHRHDGEVEAVERLVGRQPGLGEMTLDATPGPLGDLELGQGGEEPSGGPSLLVGARGPVGPEAADGGQAELVQQHRQAGGVDLELAHAAISAGVAPSSAS